MSDTLTSPPIVEAVVDLDCDLPPTFDLGPLEAPARAAFGDRYPSLRKQFLQEETTSAETPAQRSVPRRQHALQFLQDDERQLVQVRARGFSFNRLAPYSSLDDYLPEIERTWRLFVGLAAPVKVSNVRLRYINRILLPVRDRQVNLDDYVAVAPRLPYEERLTFLAFLSRYAAREESTGNRVNTVLATQPLEREGLPIILDIEAIADVSIDPLDWPAILGQLGSLRSLKNGVFRRTLTEQCQELFRSKDHS